MTEPTLRDRPLLAVMMDADNVPAKYADAILNEISSIGEPALRRVYGDWTSDRLKPWIDKIQTLGLVAYQQTANTKGKNASDIGLVIDAMDILHSRRFSGFVIVSSDSDFTSLANRLREDGLLVIGIGERKTPESLRQVCNRFIFIENIIEGSAQVPKDGQPARSKPKANDALPLILQAMDRLEDEGDWVTLAQIGQMMQSTNPDFDTRTYGHAKLSELIKSLPRFETKPEGRQIMVRRRD